MDKLIASADLKADDFIIEVGPGKGILTSGLAKKAGKVLTIEIDQDLIKPLQRKFENNKNIEITNADILKINLPKLLGHQMSKYKVVANLPYYITSPIIRLFLENENPPIEMILMVQKEVAERIASKPGKKSYGILSVLLQAYYDIEYLFTVNEDVFNPPPKVKSGVIRLIRNDVNDLGCDEKNFKTVIKTAFNQRRKTLRNSLKSLQIEEIKQRELFSLRPEQLSVGEFVELKQLIFPTNS